MSEDNKHDHHDDHNDHRPPPHPGKPDDDHPKPGGDRRVG